MKKILNFIKRRRYLVGGVLLLVLLFSILGKKNGVETYEVAMGNIRESIVLSGEVRANDRADLGFASSGRIAKIYVDNNQALSAGAILAQLEINDLLADLKIKEINSKTSTRELEDAKRELDRVTEQENTRVENAYRELLSDDLSLIPGDLSYGVTYPTISGAYDGTAEGRYKLRIVRDSINSNEFYLRTFDLENTEYLIDEEGFTNLGTRGLSIYFSDDLGLYDDTVWYLDIPNKNGSSYVNNLNAYNEAKRTRDLNIQNAKAEYEKLLTKEGNVDSVALAEIAKIQAEIRKNTIYAPFAGTVTNIEKEVGENISSGERLLTVLGNGQLEVVLQAPELDVPKLLPGTNVAVKFDALPEETFSGTLESLNSRDTEVDGVPVYEAFVLLSAEPRIKTGMSVKGEIILSEKSDVLVLPNYLVNKEGEKYFVSVLLADGKTEEREVTTGILGSDSMAEVLSGLNLGDKVIIQK